MPLPSFSPFIQDLPMLGTPLSKPQMPCKVQAVLPTFRRETQAYVDSHLPALPLTPQPTSHPGS